MSKIIDGLKSAIRYAKGDTKGTRSTYYFKDRGSVTVEDSCGCVFCDLGLETSTRVKDAFSSSASLEVFHETTHGDMPCNKPT